jgi:hypothetical protein
MSTLQEKCNIKGIPVPTKASLLTQSAREKLQTEWEDMLAHQLPVLPSFDQFWAEMPMVLDWLHQVIEKPVLQSQQVRESIDGSWQPPSMVHAWHTPVPLESIRFAAANHLCVNLQYQGSWRLIEPYSLRRTSERNILLYAVKHDSGEPRSYRIDRIQGVEISQVPFVPRYIVELTPSSPLRIPDISRETSSVPRPARATIRSGKSLRGASFGPKYVFKCNVCGKKFTHKTYDATLNPHKDKNGYPCYGRIGFYEKTVY